MEPVNTLTQLMWLLLFNQNPSMPSSFTILFSVTMYSGIITTLQHTQLHNTRASQHTHSFTIHTAVAKKRSEEQPIGTHKYKH